MPSSFLQQVKRASVDDAGNRHLNIRNSSMNMEAKMKFACDIDLATDEVASPFESAFAPSDMRQLALVAHNHMKPAM